MKILSMLIFSDPQTQGGIQTFGRTLKKFYPNEITSLTVANPFKKIYEVDDVTIVGSNNFFFRLFNKILKNKLREYLIRKEVKKNKWDTIIFSFPYELEILKDIKTKKIMVQHFNFDKFKNDIFKMKKLKEDLDYYIVLSPHDKEKFQRGFDIPEEKVKVLRHTCNMEILKEEKEKNKNLIMVARIDNFQKRFDLAIRAMKKLQDFTLNIYGDIYTQKDMDFLEEIIEKENITNVFFKGGTNKVQEKLDEAGIFVMTSDYEGYPITSIEAMRRGLPIILRNTFDSAQDIVVNDENGILLEKKWNEEKFVEAIREIYDNYEYYSENSKKLGYRYSPEIIKKEWDKILEVKQQ